MRNTELRLNRVVGMRCGDIDQIHRRIRQHVLIRAIGMCHAKPAGKGLRLVQTARGNTITAVPVIHPPDGICHLAGDVTGTQNSDIHLITSLYS